MLEHDRLPSPARAGVKEWNAPSERPLRLYNRFVPLIPIVRGGMADWYKSAVQYAAMSRRPACRW
jgi:hypothetical protein